MGNMDGVHRGHQALIGEAAKLATNLGKPLSAIVFEPHPRLVFQPDTEPFLLTTPEQKIDLLGQCGIEKVFILPFNRRLSMLSPEAFVEDILHQTLGLAGIVVGAEFQFGQKRSGTADMLDALAQQHGITPLIVTPVSLNGAAEKFSSSGARDALRHGKPEEAAHILGRPWSVAGVVQKGQQLGRTLDFPTANIAIQDVIAPAKGVYAVKARIGEETHAGVANFGSRPTVDGTGLLLEVHLFDFARDIYGENMAVDFLHYIRPETKFDGLDALKAQIAKDCETAVALLS
jgi:riboflavin kinase/FMN adenylyltransferase